MVLCGSSVAAMLCRDSDASGVLSATPSTGAGCARPAPSAA